MPIKLPNGYGSAPWHKPTNIPTPDLVNIDGKMDTTPPEPDIVSSDAAELDRLDDEYIAALSKMEPKTPPSDEVTVVKNEPTSNLTTPPDEFEQMVIGLFTTGEISEGDMEILRSAHRLEVGRAVREELEWVQKYPNGMMTMDGREIEFHAVPTNQVVKRLAALRVSEADPKGDTK